jgi:small ligand-binding sensory domain FIST
VTALRGAAGCSVASNPRAAAAQATAEAMAQAQLGRAAGALCFATSAHGAAFPMILRAVAHEAGTPEVVGCSSAGVIANEREIESGPAVAVVVFGGGELSAKRLFAPSLRRRGREVARELASAARPALGRSNLLLIFADSYNMDTDALLPALAAELPGVAIAGGGASEDGSVGETFQFCGDTVSSNSVAGMLISGAFELNVGVSVACSQIGPMHRVSAVRRNLIAGLDGRPAYEVFAEAAGPLANDLKRAQAFVFIGIPLDPKAGRLERGQYVVRNIIGASADHGVIAIAHYPRLGDMIALVLRDAERSRDDLKATLDQMSASARVPAAFGLYFDCVSRGAGLYNIPGHDSAYIRRQLGPVPVGGFFTGFEIGPLGNRAAVLQCSGVLVLVSAQAAGP